MDTREAICFFLRSISCVVTSYCFNHFDQRNHNRVISVAQFLLSDSRSVISDKYAGYLVGVRVWKDTQGQGEQL